MGVSRLHGKVARAAVAAALTGTMAFGGLFAPAVALAAANETGNMTIHVKSGDSVTAYGAYKLFGVDVEQNANGDETAIGTPTWGSDSVKVAVLRVLNNYGYEQWLRENSYVAANANGDDIQAAAGVARNALTFVAEQVEGSSGTSYDFGETTGGSRKVVNQDQFAYDLAVELSTVDPTALQAFSTASGAVQVEFSNIAEGYWMFLPGSGNTTTSFTSVAADGDDFFPIYQFIDHAHAATATKKSATSTLQKFVKGGGQTEYKKYIDAAMGDDIEYKLIGNAKKVAQDDAGSALSFTDTLPAGITLTKLSDVKVYAATMENGTLTQGSDITSQFTTSLSGSTLSIISKTADRPEGYYIVTYKARLNADAITGINAFNVNTAVMNYAGQDATPQSASVATYKIKLNNLDAATQAKLKDTAFKIAVKAADNEGVESDMYLNSSGELVTVDNAGEFKTDENGVLDTIPLVDSGITYTITEATPSADHDAALPTDGIKVTFNATTEKTYDEDGVETGDTGKVISLTASYPKDLSNIEGTFDSATGTVELTIGSNKTIILPITGMTPSQLGTVMGAALVATGAIAIAMRRRNAEQA